MRAIKIIVVLCVVGLCVAGCFYQYPLNSFVVLKFTDPSYAEYVILDMGGETDTTIIVYNQHTISNRFTWSDYEKVEFVNFDPAKIYTPLHDDYFLYFPYMIHPMLGSGSVLLNCKWSDLESFDLNNKGYEVQHIKLFQERYSIHPPRWVNTPEELVKYLNTIIDGGNAQKDLAKYSW